MRIKSLQIHGFKSFVDRTVLAFRPGITAIVGPNGCGKSNVVDAMRWAMGEQAPRRLRGRGMEDVIFAGSEARAPIGLAEVVLTFDNSSGLAPAAFAEFSEIEITRRLYRTGESEYLLNKTPCRLRDVLDFFRDTGIGTRGYTIVEQGRIASIVSAKPEERRALIEEAAGIGKYKARRREAERRLEATEQNLVRVADVLGEIRRQIASIERQARKAERYKRLRARLRVLELTLAADDRCALEAELAAERAGLAERREESAAADGRLAEREAALETARLELTERERAVARGSEALFERRSEIKQLESRMAFEARERETLGETREARREDVARLREQLFAAEAAARGAAEEAAEVEATLAAEDEALRTAEAEVHRAAEALRATERERESVNAVLVSVLTAIARSEDRLAALDERRAAIERRLRGADEALEERQSEVSRIDEQQQVLEEGLRNLLAERDRLMQALREALARQERTGEQQRAAAARFSEARARRERRFARLASLRELIEHGEDVEAGARRLLAESVEARAAHGLRAVVRDVLEVDPDAEAAVEALLAERAGALVMQRAEGALSALEWLRATGAGRSLFVVETPPQAADHGFVPLGEPLLERVRARAGYETVARALLGGAYLVPDLAEVVKRYGEGRLPGTFVTPFGDVLFPDGVLRGGGSAGTGVLARARELRELEREVAELDAETARLGREAAEADAAAVRVAEQVENLRNRHHTAALAVAGHEKDLERTRERIKALGEAQAGRAAERSDLVAETASLEQERTHLEGRLAQVRSERAEVQQRLEGLSSAVAQAGREAQRLEAELTERRVVHAGRLERRGRLEEERGRAERAAREAREWIGRREKEIEELEARRQALSRSLHEAEAQLAEALRGEEAARLVAEGARDEYEREAAAVRERESELRALRAETLGRRERVQALELELRESELRLDHLDEQIRERWSVDLASWTPPSLEDVSEASEEEAPEEPGSEAAEAPAAEPRSAELAALPREERARLADESRSRLAALGEVNLGAIEEREELAERNRFLSEQKADLEATVGSLREAIQRINRSSRRRFRETFDAVNTRFEKNFPRLFRGGRASLSLTESDDVLEAGVEILAQPPGKRLQSVTLLSGGEKTLTALALLVSLFQVHPSPFFLLDEVDAALDDANIARFNEIVREMAAGSQFLLITHNKRTIELADVLYGVTMEEKGVSKIVSVALH